MKPKSQHILFILDRSGSMKDRATDVIGGFNTYVSEMQSEAAKDGMETLVSLVTFSDQHTVVFASRPVADVEPLTSGTYRAIGNTALLDTVYDSVSRYREMIGQGFFSGGREIDAPSVLVIVFTDGMENASRAVNWGQVQGLLGECERLGNWTFTYVGAHAGAWGQADQLTIRRRNVLDAEHLSVHDTMFQVAESTKKLRTSYRVSDKKSSDSFFSEEAVEAAV